ncbi:hypothetical protein DFH08DRAFT_6447 [Mycena albidolilacea]|uniref:Macrofage activating glycoprotein n=1 Tax=Mycena albidolilacea TaxID=1033008 RepID=A0AAD7F472_9AGAR|nr:hypothetical protein DFH08DRAFT_6447 [Mycena albidolilacea]
MLCVALLTTLSLLSAANAATPTYSATYLPSSIPEHTEEGQTGTNQCGTVLNQTSACQTAYMNALDDWCLWAPPEPGPLSTIGETERIEVAWCIKSGTGSRLIPDGAITGAHWLITPDYIQVTGVGNMTLLNIPIDDEGGELDPHGADGNGNPVGGVVFSTAFGGQVEEIFEWTNFMGTGEFCFRICDPKGPRAPDFCQHIYDTLGCDFNMPANYNTGFDTCHADSGEPMGVYGTSTFHQGDPITPDPHPAPSPTNCQTTSTIGNGFLIQGSSIVGTPSATPTSGGPSATKPSGSVTATNSSNSASGGPLVQGWERVLMSVGLMIVLSLVGAAIVI